MNEGERDEQGIAVDEWCWTDMLREYVETQDRLEIIVNKMLTGE